MYLEEVEEKEKDLLEGSSSLVASEGLDATYDPAHSVAALSESIDMS